MKYRIGLPFWKIAHKLGFTLTYEVYVAHELADEEFRDYEGQMVFIAECKDLPFVCEMPDWKGLNSEIKIIGQEILEELLKTTSVRCDYYISSKPLDLDEEE